MKNEKFVRLTADKEENTRILAGHISFSVKDLEDEIDANSEIGKKLKSVEDRLKDY